MCSQRFRTFNMVDDLNRETLAIEIDLNLPVPRVIRVLERIVMWRGLPVKICMHNGPKFVFATLAKSTGLFRLNWNSLNQANKPRIST